MSLINSPDNGATEIPGTSADSLFVFLGGPIRYWWTPGVEGSPLHRKYEYWRSKIHSELSNDFLVYAAHRAWRGPWNEIAQKVNDHAVELCDAFVYLRVPGVLAHGTDEELLMAMDMGKACFPIDINNEFNSDTGRQLVFLKQQLWHLKSTLGMRGNIR